MGAHAEFFCMEVVGNLMLGVDSAFFQLSNVPLLLIEYSCATSHFLASLYSGIGSEHVLANGLILELMCFMQMES